MSLKRKKIRGLTSTVPPSLEGLGVGHRLRHHGKHHQGELWRVTTISDVINSTTIPTVDRASVCYSTNEVLIIIGLTCVLNLAFIVVVMTCVHFCSSPTVTNISRLESLILVESSTSESDLEELENKQKNINFYNFSPISETFDEYIKICSIPLQMGSISILVFLYALPPNLGASLLCDPTRHLGVAAEVST
ncbi:uncharacterized protein LOC124356300 [Homalodisca vitripennis]|uniref:uncharacterized protein LOC124356300 n=1 Tax=Homalodisca vitripennis TaxID=197043 RepID=UPI001EEA81C7|nr:uncharacterized protein LOC124356300 [Homalodisca vitripennis]